MSIIPELAAARIFVRDALKARDFYTVKLGLPEAVATEGYVVYALGSCDLVVETTDPDDVEGRTLIGRFLGVSLAVENAETSTDELAALGVAVVGAPERQPWGGTLAHISDPDGNILTLLQRPER